MCNIWEQMEFLEYGMFGCLFVNFGQSFGHLWWAQRPGYKWLKKVLYIVLVHKALPKGWGRLLWCSLQEKSFLNMGVNADVLQEGTAGERRVESNCRHCWFLYEECGYWKKTELICECSTMCSVLFQTGEKSRDEALEAIKGNLDGFSRDAKMHPTPAAHPKKPGL